MTSAGEEVHAWAEIAPVAQLDRATVFETVGRAFESHPGYFQMAKEPNGQMAKWPNLKAEVLDLERWVA